MDSQRETYYLPNELWDLIFDHGEQKDFIAISLVCKRLHELVVPYLYRDFNWIPDVNFYPPYIENMGGSEIIHSLHKGREKSAESLSFGPAPYLLLRALLNRPSLARHVKNVKLLAVSPHIGLFWNDDEAFRGGLTESELSRCYKAIKNMSTVGDENWIDWLHEGRLDVIIGILVSLLSNLSSAEIRVRYGATSGNVVFRGLCSRLYGKGCYVKRNIKSVTISLDKDAERRWPMVETSLDPYHMDEQTFWLLQLPQLEHFSVSHLYNGIMDFMFLGNEIRQSAKRSEFGRNLKQLKLPHSVISEDGLNALLHATPHLEDFECDLRYMCGGPAFCKGERLTAALSKVSETLRRLKLNFEVIYGYRHDDVIVETPIRSMKHFKKLKYLDIPLISIMPTFGSVSSSTLEEILPDDMDRLMLRPYPSIMDGNRREVACRALTSYIAKKPWLDEDRSKHLASPNPAKRFGMGGDGFAERLDRIAGRRRWNVNMYA